jgi:hypothetical protein
MTKRKKTYLTNKNKKIGDKCICPICKSEFIKSHYAQAFCCNECKVKYHNDKQIGKRNDYFRNYNLEHPERYERVGIDLAFEKWKEEYYRECSCFGEQPPVTIDEEELYRQFRNI